MRRQRRVRTRYVSRASRVVWTLLAMWGTLVPSPASAEDPYARERRERVDAERRRQADQERFDRQQQARQDAAQRAQQMRDLQMEGARAAARFAEKPAPSMKRRPPGSQVLWSEGLTELQKSVIEESIAAGKQITSVAFKSDGEGFVVIRDRNDYFVHGFRAQLAKDLEAAKARGDEIRSVVVAKSGTWAFLRNSNEATWSSSMMPEVIKAINEVHDRKEKIWHLALTHYGHVIVHGANSVTHSRAPERLISGIATLGGGILHSLSIRESDDAYVASVHGATHSSEGIPEGLRRVLDEAASKGRELTVVVLKPGGGWVAIGQY